MNSVSYCILSFNRKNQLNNLLTQLINTKIPNSEIVVVDNGSTDGTRELVPNYPDVKFVLKDTNTGVSKGWNSLFKESSGDLVFIFNDDYEVLSGGWEQTYLDVMNQQLGIMSFPRSISPVGSEIYGNWVLEGTNRYTHNFRLFGIPRVIYDKVGGFDEFYMYSYEDTDLNMKAVEAGYPLLEMNLGKVYIQHLKDFNKPRTQFELDKEKIHSDNLGRNANHFYQRWPKGI